MKECVLYSHLPLNVGFISICETREHLKWWKVCVCFMSNAQRMLFMWVMPYTTSGFLAVCKTLFTAAHLFPSVPSAKKSLCLKGSLKNCWATAACLDSWITWNLTKIFLDLDVYKAAAAGLKLYSHLTPVVSYFYSFKLNWHQMFFLVGPAEDRVGNNNVLQNPLNAFCSGVWWIGEKMEQCMERGQLTGWGSPVCWWQIEQKWPRRHTIASRPSHHSHP